MLLNILLKNIWRDRKYTERSNQKQFLNIVKIHRKQKGKGRLYIPSGISSKEQIEVIREYDYQKYNDS